MDDNFLKLVKINIERHPNAKMCISKMTGTILYLKCSNCKTSMSKKCACLCSCQNNDISRNNDKLPSSSDFKKVNNNCLRTRNTHCLAQFFDDDV